jgi:hypothetical protein
MRKNVGVVDQISRLVVGAVAIYGGYVNHSYFWYVVGSLAILSGFFAFCPLYALVGLNTCQERKD